MFFWIHSWIQSIVFVATYVLQIFGKLFFVAACFYQLFMYVNVEAKYFWNVCAQVSPGCTSMSLSDRDRYPYFTRMAPSLRFNVVAVYEVLKVLGYQRVGIIYGYRSINNLVKDLFLEMMASDNAAGSYSWTPLYTYQVKSVADAQAAIAMAASKDSRTRICVAIQSLQICFVYFLQN